MRGLATHITRTIVPMSVINCADNSGALKFRMINKRGKGHRHGRLAAAGIGDMITASVIKGSPNYLKKPVLVVIVRQKAPIRRANGMRIRFEDNAGVMVDDSKFHLPIGTEVKGAMAREVVEINVKLAGIAPKII